jgi:hypothetical protein
MPFGKQAILLLCLAALSGANSAPVQAGLFGYDTFWECILDKMPGVQNDVAANAVAMQCHEKAPSLDVSSKSSRMTWQECVIKHGKNAVGSKGPMMIQAACYNLYN